MGMKHRKKRKKEKKKFDIYNERYIYWNKFQTDIDLSTSSR